LTNRLTGVVSLLAAASMIVLAGAPAPTTAAQRAPCRAAPPPSALASAAALKRMDAFLGSLGARHTGSPAQVRYIDWIRSRLAAIHGVRLSELKFTIDRWTPSSAKLRIRIDGRPSEVPIADAIPYSKSTGAAGVTAPVVLVPADQRIVAANARGRIVVREADAGSIPQADFLLPFVMWNVYDPHHTINPAANFYGDFIAYNSRVADLRDAAAAGAEGILFVKNLPRAQILGHYEPYEGTAWRVPGAFLGADQGKLITDALTAGRPISAQIVVSARFKRVITPSLLATIAGRSPQRIVIDSHTDGTNAVEDNGPIAMVAMARYFAALPRACRPRTLEFAFSTAHFYQRVGANPTVRDGGAEQLAKRLDTDYDHGTVSSVLALEHLGALDYEAVPRRDGGAGEMLRPNGLRAIQFIGVTPSARLVSAVDSVVRRYDMQRTLLLQGSDAPGSTVPPHCSFGGEGTPYERHLLPTIGVIAAPQTLYDPAFGIGGIDFNVMRSETLGYTELVNRLGSMSQSAIAGQVPAERARRKLGASAACPPAN
jgi:hypothetical protein